MPELSAPEVAAAGNIAGYGENRAGINPEDEGGRVNLLYELLYQTTNALKEAQAAGRLVTDPLIEAILFTRARYIGTDQTVADHLWRMAVLRLEPPQSLWSMDYRETALTRQDHNRLIGDRARFNDREVGDLPPGWREAIEDMAALTFYESLWGNH